MGEQQRVTVQRATGPRSATQSATRMRPVSPRGQRGERDPGTPPLQPMMAARALQPRLAVGAADDPFEREAERAADAATSANRLAAGMPAGQPAGISLSPVVRRALGKAEAATKKDDDDKKKMVQKIPSASGGPEVAPAQIESTIQSMSGGGQPLPGPVRSAFEPRFGYDFGAVRTHAESDAAGAAVGLGARAFTVGDHIFFAPGEFRPDTAVGQRLIAHELAHTIQQKPQGARAASVQRDYFPDPKKAALEKISQWASELPPYELLTVLLGRNPITDEPVERSARNFLHAGLRLVPDGMAIFDDLEKNKTIEKTAAWFDAEITKLNLTWDGIKALFQQAWDAIGVSDFLSPAKAWEKVKAIFGPTLKRILDFAINVGGKILDFIKKAVLDKLGAWAKQQKGYGLLCFVLGKDPVTDEPVERTAKHFVKAVLDLVPGGDKIFENLEKSKTIERTVEWLEGEIKKLDLSWEKIKELFRKAWDAFKVADLLHPLTLIEKIADIFVAPAKRVITFALAVGKKVLEFIFEGAMMIAGPIGMQIVRIVRKIGDTFHKIIEDPVGFVGNLVKAVKLGFEQFSKNIWEHLKTGLIEWLVGALEGAGLVLPKVWDLKGILSLVLQILGISYAKMRVKLVKVIGEERVAMLERIFDFIKLLVTEGPAAAWQKIVEAIGSLWDMVIGGIKDWAITKIIKAAITKIATMLNPAGAIIQAIIAIYNTIAFFVERIKQILALVEAVVDSIANIAAGKLTDAANFVERAMARTIPVIIGFLASLIGLGDVSDAIKKVILAIQEKVDKGIDAATAWVVEKAKALFAGKEKAEPPPGPPGPLTPEQAAQAKAAALDDVEPKLRSGKLHSIGEMQEVIDGTLNKHRPAGLKTLYIEVTDEATLGFDVIATASEPERRTLHWNEAFAPDDEARALFAAPPRFETNAVLSINGSRFGETVASDEQGHAEQNLIASYWKDALKVLAASARKGVHSTLVFAVNRAPCHTRCSPALVNAISNVSAEVRASTTFILAATGTYEPTENLDDDEVDAAEKEYDKVREKLRSAGREVQGYKIISRAKLKEHATRMSDLDHLAAAGWDLHQLQVRPHPTSAGIVLAEAAHKVAVRAGLVKAGG